MKLIVHSPGGVLENVIGLVGYEATCLMVVDDPALATAVFGAVGERLVDMRSTQPATAQQTADGSHFHL